MTLATAAHTHRIQQQICDSVALTPMALTLFHHLTSTGGPRKAAQSNAYNVVAPLRSTNVLCARSACCRWHQSITTMAMDALLADNIVADWRRPRVAVRIGVVASIVVVRVHRTILILQSSPSTSNDVILNTMLRTDRVPSLCPNLAMTATAHRRQLLDTRAGLLPGNGPVQQVDPRVDLTRVATE